VTNAQVEKRLTESDTDDGFILDGFARSLGQAAALQLMLRRRNSRIDVVLDFD
jgi:adenylate kinase